MNSLSNRSASRTLMVWFWFAVALTLAVGLSFMLTGCAGKDGINHPNADDWKAFKDVL